MAALGVALLAYVIGCFSTGYYLVRFRTGGDLRSVGSGATGGRNAGRVLGRSGLLLTGAGDLAKAVIAVGVPIVLGLGPLEVAAAMVGVMAGHIWPFQLGFRGGKGVAPFIGSTVVAAPVALVTAGLLAAVAVLISRRPNIGGLAGFAITPAIALALGQPLPIVVALAAAVVLGAVAHRSNLRQELRPSAPSVSRLAFGGPDPLTSRVPFVGRVPFAGRLPFVGRWIAQIPGGRGADG